MSAHFLLPCTHSDHFDIGLRIQLNPNFLDLVYQIVTIAERRYIELRVGVWPFLTDILER